MKKVIPAIVILSLVIIAAFAVPAYIIYQTNQAKSTNLSDAGWVKQLRLMKNGANAAYDLQKPEAATQAPTESATEKPAETDEDETEPTTQEPTQPSYVDESEIIAAAEAAVANCTDSSMTKEEKLRAAFDYLKNNYLEGLLRDTYVGEDWAKVYAYDMLVKGKGDCFSYGASFAYLAKAIGSNDVYACSTGGHGWAEVEGRVYDPEWSLHSDKYSYFGMTYEEPCDVDYSIIETMGGEYNKIKLS